MTDFTHFFLTCYIDNENAIKQEVRIVIVKS